MRAAAASLVRRTPVHLEADRSRVITRLFVPGQEPYDREDSRTSQVMNRILALPDSEAQEVYDDVRSRFEDRHRYLDDTFRRHAEELVDRLDPGRVLSQTRRLLLGATFTSEYAIEGAALCNPSIVAAPDQGDVAAGSLRFVMSVRGIGEGHRSSIGFRTGIVDETGAVEVEAPPRYATTGVTEPAAYDAEVFRGEVERLRSGGESSDFVLDALGNHFDAVELEQQLGRLQRQSSTRRRSGRTITMLRQISERTYGTRFTSSTPLAERVLWPAMEAERTGMEDARFVRLVEADDVRYYATYTAFDGTYIRQQLLETADFETFTSSPIVGPAAADKGLALFPRRINGQYAALSRSDRESNAIATSDNPHRWSTARPCQAPDRWWESVQLGNCGSPIETDAGWLVLTHGVGPMRTYSIGALLLDLEDPTRIVGRLEDPLLSPTADERDGYVPNVVYSCGALVHAGVLVVPYGVGDQAISVATVPLDELLGQLAG